MLILSNYIGSYLVLGLIVAVIIVIVVFFALTDKGNRKLEKYSIFGKESKTYTIKVDFSKQQISFYKKQNTITTKEYRLQDFQNMLDADKQRKWMEWSVGLLKEENESANRQSTIVLGIHGLEGETDSSMDLHWIRVSFKSITGTIIYLTGIEIDMNIKERINSSSALLMIDWPEFQQLVASRNEKEADGRGHGALICINGNLFDVIRKRYNLEVANQYLNEVWADIHSMNSKERIAGHYQQDSFLIYIPGCLTKHAAERIDKVIMEDFEKTIAFDIYQFELLPSVGVAFMNQFTDDLEELASDAYQASQIAKEQGHMVFYDEKMESERHSIKEYFAELNRIISEMSFNPLFFPVFSLQNGNVVGYFSEVDFSKYLLKDFAEAYKYATRADMEKRFFGSVAKTWLETFIKMPDRESRKIFIFCDLKMLEMLEELIMSTSRYNEIDIVAVITKYGDLLNAGDKVRELLFRAKESKINLGVVADESMQTSVLSILHYFNWLILPSKMTKLVGIDQRTKLVITNIVEMMERFNLNVIAWNVNNYSQAEILKSLGVMYMHGPILDSREDVDYSSVRKVAKLIDEKE